MLSIISSGLPIKKILMTTDTVGGVWTYSLELARALGEYGVETALAAMGGPVTAAQRDEAAQVPLLRLFEKECKLEWMNDPWDDVSESGEWLLNIERTFRPDVVQVNGFAHGSLRWKAPCLVVAHSCVLSWWQCVKGCSAPPEWNQYRKRAQQGLNAARMVIAPTRTMLAFVKRHYGAIRRGIVIPNGRNPDLFSPAEKMDFIVSVGRIWDEAKNLRTLDRVSTRIAWPVYAAGDTAHPEGGEVRLAHMQPLGRLPAPKISEWLSRASIYALPARYEPFGLSVLEAALSGCALVLGDIPSLREIWNEAAVFVSPDNEHELEKALGDLISDGARRSELAFNARRRALGYNPGMMALGYLAAYRELASRCPQTSGIPERYITVRQKTVAC